MKHLTTILLMVTSLGCGSTPTTTLVGATGATGTNGAQGAQGSQGAKGDTGNPHVVSEFSCKQSTDQKRGFIKLNFTYKSITYNNGDVWVKCSVNDFIQQEQSSDFFKASEPEAKTSLCAVEFYSITEHYSVNWTFTASGAERKAVRDGVLRDGTTNFTVDFTSTDCQEF